MEINSDLTEKVCLHFGQHSRYDNNYNCRNSKISQNQKDF